MMWLETLETLSSQRRIQASEIVVQETSAKDPTDSCVV